jgi:hypothetical protein
MCVFIYSRLKDSKREKNYKIWETYRKDAELDATEITDSSRTAVSFYF